MKANEADNIKINKFHRIPDIYSFYTLEIAFSYFPIGKSYNSKLLKWDKRKKRGKPVLIQHKT